MPNQHWKILGAVLLAIEAYLSFVGMEPDSSIWRRSFFKAMHVLSKPKVCGSVFTASSLVVAIMLAIERYTLANIFLGISCACGCLFLANMKCLRKQIKKGRRFTYRNRPWLQFAACLPLVVLTIYVMGMVNQYALDKRLSQSSDWLVPADEPTPENACDNKVPTDSLLIILGSLAAFNNHFPHTVLAIGGTPLLQLDKNQKGEIAVSTDVMDDNDNEIVEIEHNHFTPANDVFMVKRKDLNSLSVIVKHEKQEVLNVRYLNAQVIRITGIFNRHGIQVIATQSSVETRFPYGGRFIQSGSCFGETSVLDFGFQ